MRGWLPKKCNRFSWMFREHDERTGRLGSEEVLPPSTRTLSPAAWDLDQLVASALLPQFPSLSA